MSELWRLSLEEAAAAVRDKRASPTELVESCLARIEQVEDRLNAFIAVTGELALQEAAGELGAGPLRGVPIALKDLFDVAGLRTTAGSKLRADHVATEDSAAWRRLRAAGAVLIGKTNLHEWAFGVTNDNPHFGPTRNPYDVERIPGGSSGGNAAALATGCAFGAVGSDTGGSIRIPASLCGIVGLKPTYGRVPLDGCVPLSWTLDHAGPMARSVRDTALLYDVLADADTLRTVEDGAADVVIGELETPLIEADPEVEGAVSRAAANLGALAKGHVRVRGFPGHDELRETQRTILSTDAFAYHRERVRDHAADFGADVLARLRVGSERTGADYALARHQRRELRLRMLASLRHCDVLALPATAAPASVRAGADAVAVALQLTAVTAPFNLTGLPAASLPCGMTKGGLPIGLQLVGRPGTEALLLRVARAYEREQGAPVAPRI